MSQKALEIVVKNAQEHNLKGVDVRIPRAAITLVTGVSGSGKSSLVFDTILAEAQRRFFYTLSHYSRQFLDLSSRPKVASISGLSPAIALAQVETPPSVRASVGTLSDLSELMGVLFARFGEKTCPDHGTATETLSLEDMAAKILAEHKDQIVAVCAPIVEKKKGHYKAVLTKFAEKGYLKVFIDGESLPLTPIPELAKEEKHSIKIIIDHVKITTSSQTRLVRALASACQEADGFAETYLCHKRGEIDLNTRLVYSKAGGCAICGYSWPKLDARYFSANSLGRCQDCDGFGYLDAQWQELDRDRGDLKDEDESSDLLSSKYRWPCQKCQGTGLSKTYEAITLAGKSMKSLSLLSLAELKDFLEKLDPRSQAMSGHKLHSNPAFIRVWEEVYATTSRLCKVGLSYLHMARRVRTLSGGEGTRLRLAGILSESLRGVLYVLDEPSQGLHPSEMEELYQNLKNLRDLGNSILIVDHDELLIRKSDLIIDLGPGGGRDGGVITGVFTPQTAHEHQQQSATAFYLSRSRRDDKNSVKTTNADQIQKKSERITIFQATLHNVKLPRVHFLLSQFNVVTGVSGAGKSSLVVGILYANLLSQLNQQKPSKKALSYHHCQKISGIEHIENVSLVDRKPLGKSGMSLPATFLDIFTEIREIYAQLPDAQIYGLKARDFSLQVEGGRCENCKGRGEILLTMKFLPEARVPCEVCERKRYKEDILHMFYNGLSIYDVLELTIEQACEHFKYHKRIIKKLQPARDLGLGYLKLGQPSSSLSGGEAQRLKLIPYVVKNHSSKTVLILDEPTRGLHFADVEKLLQVLRSLIEKEVTIVCIEHNLDVIGVSDWVVDLGPGAAHLGGQLVYEGKPEGLKNSASKLKEYL